MTKLQAEIIIGLADNHLNVSQTARKLYMHRTTLSYHIQQIRQLTGKDPMDFYGMCELLPTARRVFNGINEQTINALYEIGRKTHGGCDA